MAYIAPLLRRQIGLALSLGLLAAPGQAAAPNVQVRNGLSYGPLDAEKGDLYLPSTPSRHRAAVVLIHGGGWYVGSRGDYTDIAKAVASHGLAAFTIDYRLARADQPQTHWPAQLLDAQLAVRYLRAHAAEFGLEGGRIGAMGDSAGGQLAVLLGVLHTREPGDAANLDPAESPSVAAVVDEYGPITIRAAPSSMGSITALFGKPNPTEAELASMSPLPYVTAQSAPVYILHGLHDELVPFQDSEALAAKLIASGVQTVFVPFQGGHSYEGVPPEQVLKLQSTAIEWLKQQLEK